MKFEWDEVKRQANLKKHGVDFIVAARIMSRGTEWKHDGRRDYGENRYLVYGVDGGRLHVVVFSTRGEVVRIISVRKANKRERREYEQPTAE